MKHFIAGAIPFLITLATARAGTLTYTGSEQGFWDRRALVVARIISGTFDKSDGTADVEVVAVALTDTPVETRLTIRWVAGGGSALGGLDPVPGDLVAMCIEKQDDRWVLNRHFVKFFSSGRPAEKIADLKDERLQQLIARARATKTPKDGR